MLYSRILTTLLVVLSVAIIAHAQPANKPVAPPKAATQPDTTSVEAPAAEKPTSSPADGKAVPAAAPAPTPSPAPASKPVEPVVKTPEKTPEEKAPVVKKVAKKVVKKDEVFFRYAGVPYMTVLQRFAQLSNKPLMGEVSIDGSLTFEDPNPYTYREAFDTLNLLLATKGFVLREEGRFLRLRPLAEVPSVTKIYKGMAEAKAARPNEIITVVMPLRYLNPTEATKTVIRMVSSFGSISPLIGSKGLIITDTKGNIDRVTGLLSALDQETMVDRKLKTYILKNASVRTAAGILTNVVGPKATTKYVYDARARRLVPAAPDPQDIVQISFDERSNMLVLVGSGERLLMAEQMIATLDKDSPAESGDLRIFELKNAVSTEVARQIQQLISTVKRDKKGKLIPSANAPKIIPDAASNRLLVSATPNLMPRIEKLIKELDKGATETARVRVIPMKVIDASTITRAVSRALGRPDSRGRVVSALNVSAEPRTNSLILSGPSADIVAAEKLIALLDKAPGEGKGMEVHVVQLVDAKPQEVTQVLSTLFANRHHGKGRYVQRPSVVVNQTTNTLFVFCQAADWVEASLLLAKMETYATGTAPVTRLIPLNHAQASQIAGIVTNALRQGGAVAGGSKKRRGRKGVQSASDISIVAMPRSNSLLVTAPVNDQAQAASLIETLDQPAADVEPFVMIRLTSAKSKDIVTQIRLLIPEAGGKNPTVFVQADSLTNSVLLRADESKRKMIEEMIAKLEQAVQADARETKILTLENLTADALKATLQQLYPRRRGEESGAVIITAAPHGKALIIEAPRRRLEQVVTMATNLDKAGGGNIPQVRTYRLASGSAADLATSLTSIFGRRQTKGGTPPQFASDAATNQLIVSARAAEFEEIESLVKKLQETSALALQSKTYTLKFAKPTDIVTLLEAMLGQDRGTQWLRRKYKGEIVESQLRIATIPGSNTIIVQGSPQILKGADELIQIYDTQDATGIAKRQVRTYRIAKGSATQTASTMSKLFALPRGKGSAQPPKFEGDEISNQIFVAASAEQFVEIEKFIDKLEKEVLLTETQTFRLAHAKASDIASILEKILLKDGGANKRRWWSSDVVGELKIKIVPVVAANAVIVQGAPEQIKMAKQLIETFDTDKASLISIEVVRLTNADAGTLAKAVTRSIPRKWGDEATTVTAEPNSNSILIRGPVKDVAKAVAMIKELDKDAVSEDVQVRVFPLTNSDANEMATNIRTMFQDIGSQQRASKSAKSVQLSIIADARTNSLVITTTPAHFATIEEMLKALDAGEKSARDVEYVFLSNADAADVITQLDTLFLARKYEDRPVIQGDFETNALTLIATESDMQQMLKVIEKLDDAVAGVRVRVIPLENVRADKMAEMLKRLYEQMGDNEVEITDKLPEGSDPAVPTPAVKTGTDEIPPTVGVLATKPKIYIAVDTKSNSLIVSGPRRDLEEIDTLVAQLSFRSEAAEAEYRVYSVVNGDPAVIAKTLTDLFNVAARGKSSAGSHVLTAVAEPRTRKVIVKAKPLDFDLIEPMIKQLDTDDGGGITAELLTLENATASDLERVLSKAAGARQPARGTKGSRTAATSGAIVTAEPTSNTLVISGPVVDVQAIVAMAKKLDQAAISKSTGVYILPLTHGDASTVAGMITDLYNQQVKAARRSKQRVEPMAISVDTRANAIVVASSKLQYDNVRAWVTQMETMKPARGKVHIIQLYHADPADLKKAIDQMYNQNSGSTPSKKTGKGVAPTSRSGSSRSGSSRVQATVLAGSSSVMVSASDAEFAQIKSLVTSLEAAAITSKREERILTVKNGSNMRISAALTRILKLTGRSSRPGDQVTMTALPNSNAILVAALPERMKDVVALLAQLDKPGVSPGAEFKAFVLKNADPEKVLPTLTNMLMQYMKANPGDTVSVAADSRTRSIIVTAREGAFAEIGKLIDMLDVKSAYATADVLVVPLLRADATQLASVLQSMLKPADGKAVTPEALALQEQVRRLRLHSAADGKKIPELDLTKPIKIDVDSATPQGSNALVLTSTPENLAALSALIKVLDTLPITTGVTVKMIPLKHAQAIQAMAVLQEVFKQGKALAGRPGTTVEGKAIPTTDAGKALTHELNVAADVRTNLLIIAGSEATVTLAELVAKDLDREGNGPMEQVQIFPLENADASRVLAVVESLYVGANKDFLPPEGLPTMVADLRLNALVVAGSKKSMAMLTGLIRRLDMKASIDVHGLKLVPLANADAATMAPTLQKMMDSRVQRQASLGAKDSESMRSLIAADARSNSLIVGGSIESYNIIASLAKQLDQAEPALRGQVQLLPLTHGTASTIAMTMTSLFDRRYAAARTPELQREKPIILADARVNALLVAANKDDTTILKGLLKKLDVALIDPAIRMTVIPLKHNDAGVVGTMLTQIFADRMTSMTVPGTKANPQERVSVVADSLSNSMILAANKENTMLVLGLLAKVDIEPADETGIVRMYPLVNADAGRVATMLDGLVQKGLYKPGLVGSTDSSVIVAREQVSIAVDTRTNVLIVSASKENFAVIEEVLKQVDAAPDFGLLGNIRVFHIAKADVEELAPMMQKFFDDKRKAETTTGSTGRSLPVVITADDRTNTLVVAGSREAFMIVEALIKKLDVSATASGLSHRVFALQRADATEVVTTLQAMYKAESDTHLTFSADERTNSVIVSAAASDMIRIAKVIDGLDRRPDAQVTVIRRFPLSHADAEELAKLMMDILTNKPKEMTNIGDGRQTLLEFVYATADGKELVSTALRQGLLIQPDKRTNALVISAPKNNIPMLASLIASLDAADPREAEIRVFALENADAAQVAEILENLFRIKDTAGTSRTSAAVQYQLTSKDGKVATTTTGSAQSVALNITIDARTNSLLIGGTKKQLTMAQTVVAELDSSPAQERITKVYHPKNAPATDIATALRAFLDQEKARLVAALGSDRLGAAHRLLERDVAVAAEENSNTLLISASPRYFKTLAKMIDELDREPAQVLIQVLMAEVMLSDSTEFGIDWRYLGSDVKAATGFGIRAQVEADSMLGMAVAVTSGDMSFFLRALQKENRLEVISRPQIIATDNMESTIVVGERIPLITETRLDDNNNWTSSFEWTDIGVQLDVLPRIGSDDTVRMEIKPSLTAIGTTTTQISEFVQAPSIITREAKTNVTCYDEQTIIMGGLILTNDTIREDRVPVLGDLDWLGTLFRSKDNSTTRNELVIFLTPRIMHSKARQREVTLDELRSNDTLRTVVRNHSLKGKSFDTIIDPELREEVEKISEEIPTTKREQRDENMRRTIETLEIVPEDVYKGDFYYQRNDIKQKRLAKEAENKKAKQVATPDEAPVKRTVPPTPARRTLYVPTEVEAKSK